MQDAVQKDYKAVFRIEELLENGSKRTGMEMNIMGAKCLISGCSAAEKEVIFYINLII
jgi:hypothetical protein